MNFEQRQRKKKQISKKKYLAQVRNWNIKEQNWATIKLKINQ
jgi:hypothetical protein